MIALLALLAGAPVTVREEDPLAGSYLVGATARPRRVRPERVWLDLDPSVGLPGKDVDDGIATLMAFGSPEIEVVGISVVFGNAPLPDGKRIAEELAAFGPRRLPVIAGAAGPGDDAEEVVAGMTRALDRGPLTLLALGPLTHVAALLRASPRRLDHLQRVIVVAGRLPGQVLQTGDHRHRDFNLEQDPAAMEALLASSVPITLAPWELSRQVRLGADDLSRWDTGPAAWLAARSESWLALWSERFGVPWFNPFDALAVELVVAPRLVGCTPAGATLEQAPDDRGREEPPPLKPYLIVRPGGPGRPVVWCGTVDDRARDDLQRRLGVAAPHRATGFTEGTAPPEASTPP
jgi:inosine-uridine nucleoside N-ribohydrolase